MESRAGSVLLAALLLQGCALFHRHKAAPPEVVPEEDTAAPSIIDPQVKRRDIKTPKIDTEDFEIGTFFGAMSIQDFGTNPVYGLRAAYHVNEDIFMEAFVGRSKGGTSSLEDTFPAIQLLTDSERQFTYYDLDVGYNFLPGEIFLGRGRAYNSALYATVGIGGVKFAGQDKFALNFGVGTRILITDWLSAHMDVRDHVFETDLTGKVKNVHNIEANIGFAVFF
jgi:outer membrane beta-barrel protein